MWTDEKIAELRRLWAEGHSTAEIGRRLNVSKNAIGGKGFRLGLESLNKGPTNNRLAPEVLVRVKELLQAGWMNKAISLETGVRHDRVGEIRRGMDLPKLPQHRTMARIVPRKPVVAQPKMAPLPPSLLVVLTPAKPVIVAPAKGEAPKSPRPARECCWPIGEPRTPGFRYCSVVAVLGKPYCEGHCRVGYTKVRDRDRDQAA